MFTNDEKEINVELNNIYMYLDIPVWLKLIKIFLVTSEM